uniref:C2H2-type domain-containing protein n=1 Tax=Percolomonas cosmopolitus TaxID=63605 RepID=A0A7S1KQC0_9EUKA|mmetsp:Transcript_2767/g.10653  ORF Transcript_2767/g.10653 Transcript_2767/m.10653 type:complete len:887 (+) Transcript_2767:99-2759(+)
MSHIIHSLRRFSTRKRSQRLKRQCHKIAQESRPEDLLRKLSSFADSEGSNEQDEPHPMDHVFQDVTIEEILSELEIRESRKCKASHSRERNDKRKKQERFLSSSNTLESDTKIPFSRDLPLGYARATMHDLQNVISSKGTVLESLKEGFVKIDSHSQAGNTITWACQLHAFGEDSKFSISCRQHPSSINSSPEQNSTITSPLAEVKTDDVYLSPWCTAINQHLREHDPQQTNPKIIIRTGIEFYELHYKQWRSFVVDDTKKSLQMTWKDLRDEELEDVEQIIQAKEVILSQVKAFLVSDSPFFELRPINLFWWQLKLSQFNSSEALSRSTRLDADLQRHAEKFETSDPSILVEIKFPYSFPRSPPNMRVIRPRMRHLTGGVTFSGVFESPLFTGSRWDPRAHLLALCFYLRTFLVKNSARIDLKTSKLYETQIAQRSQSRTFSSLFHKQNISTQNSFDREFFLYNMDFAAQFLNIEMSQLERGNRILLPQGVADEIFSNPFFEMPLLFEIDKGTRHTYVSVAEFTAPNGIAILPNFLMKSLLLSQGSKARIRCVTLPKAQSAKFQPHNKKFYKLKNHKQVLEHTLRSFATLTEGSSIPIQYMGENHFIEVVELDPSPAAHIVADPYLDLRVDFEAAADLHDGESPTALDELSDTADLSPHPGQEPGEDTFLSPAHQTCTNCGQSISKSRMIMHSVHCEKNYTKCSNCSRSVLRSELENHQQKYHALTECSACGIELEKCKLKQHKSDECQMRVEYCQFCELPLKPSEKFDHEVACGSQTEMCVGCDQYVFLKERDAHRAVCSGRHLLSFSCDGGDWRPEDEFTCPYCMFPSLLFEELVQHLKSVHENDENAVCCPICSDAAVKSNEQRVSQQQITNLLNHLHLNHT